mgnify:CR=1 FL=1
MRPNISVSRRRCSWSRTASFELFRWRAARRRRGGATARRKEECDSEAEGRGGRGEDFKVGQRCEIVRSLSRYIEVGCVGACAQFLHGVKRRGAGQGSDPGQDLTHHRPLQKSKREGWVANTAQDRGPSPRKWRDGQWTSARCRCGSTRPLARLRSQCRWD